HRLQGTFTFTYDPSAAPSSALPSDASSPTEQSAVVTRPGDCMPVCLGWPDAVRNARGRLGGMSDPRARPTQAGSWGARQVERLPHGGEGRWHQQLVGLPDRPYPRLGWPRATGLTGGLTHAGALGEILVHPDVDEFIQPAELARPARRQGRELLPRLNGCAPPLQHLWDVALAVGVGPHLIHVPDAVVPAAQGVHKGRRIHNLGFLFHDQVPTAGEPLPFGVLSQRGAHRRALLQVIVGIDVDDLIERPELGMPEGP